VSSRKKWLFIILLSIISLSLTGCLGPSPEEKMYNVMEEVVKEEKGFEEQQQPLVDLEKKERELYDKMISLGGKEHAQLVELADEALKTVADRKKHIDLEQESLDASKEKFKSVATITKEIKDEKLKNKANELNKIMIKRYEIHNDLFEEYQLGIKYDTELYNMLKQEDVSLDKLEEQVSKINETYDKVLKTNEEFNSQTKKYNNAKLDFYKQAGFNISNK
jgi:hypothetical protein